MVRIQNGVFLLLLLIFVSCETKPKGSPEIDEHVTWRSYLGSGDQSHFSTLSDITPENVSRLAPAWIYEAPDYGQMQMNPIIIDSVLFGITAGLRVVALNAESGKEIWRFGDPKEEWHSVSRGVSYWEKGADKRILFSRGPYLYALDATTGKPKIGFGESGKLDLRTGMPFISKNRFVISTTPGTIFEDLIIMPLRLSESVGAAPGYIMAFNIVSGDLVWTFKTIPGIGEFGSDTWDMEETIRENVVGGANNWAGMALDPEAGVVYIPTGSAAPDFYGSMRKGTNLFANCLLALDARTGERIWHFQLTHHDLWDRDPPAPPNLLTVRRNGEHIPAVAQVTKQGYVYLFDRRNGQPLFEIEERQVPTSQLKGETAWSTQPFPVKPRPFARQSNQLTREDISPFSNKRDSLGKIFDKMDTRIYAPPGLDPALLFPGYDGGAEWGGAGADPENGILYVNSNEMPWILQMQVKDGLGTDRPFGEKIYQTHCAACHLNDRSGNEKSGYPTLVGVEQRLEKGQIFDIVEKGQGRMLGFPQLTASEKEALYAFLTHVGDKQEAGEELATSYDLPYEHMGYLKFLDEQGLPAISPPWGSLHAIDLNSGDYLWSINLGNTPELGADGIGTGTENYGGPIITQNGLLLIAATRDGYFRAFDRHTGDTLWEYQLPAPAFATPAIYEINGKTYIAVACGGEKLGTKKGNTIMAFSLP